MVPVLIGLNRDTVVPVLIGLNRDTVVPVLIGLNRDTVVAVPPEAWPSTVSARTS